MPDPSPVSDSGPAPIGPVVRWPDVEPASMLPGIRAALAVGDQLSAAFYTLDPGAVVPEHSHPNEEFGQVVEGSLELRWTDPTGPHTAVLAAGEAFILPGGVRHAAVAGVGGCRLLECYAPPRTPTAPTAAPSTEDR
ncbi:MAG TPA: cupin domain-containing protein [Mycobacteriales bacterium]|nr:cupin domain-containing protein [Mycobacteriales bacterium]